jgi:hypothetical protein
MLNKRLHLKRTDSNVKQVFMLEYSYGFGGRQPDSAAGVGDNPVEKYRLPVLLHGEIQCPPILFISTIV